VLSMLNSCLQAHNPNDWIWAYLWMPLGLMMGVYRVYIKNANGQLQFASGVVLQAIGHCIYTLINAIKWVGYGSWLSQPEGVLSVILEVFQEKWLMLSAALVVTWQVAVQFVLQCGAWKLGKANNVTVLPTKKEPPDPHPRPVRGVAHYLCSKARLTALLLLLMLQQHALAQVPSFEFQSELLSRVQDADVGCGLSCIRNISSKMKLRENAIAQVPRFENQSEFLNVPDACGLLQSRNVSMQDQGSQYAIGKS